MPISLLPGLDAQLAIEELPLPTFRKAIKDSKEQLAQRFHAGDPIEDLVHARAYFIDEILQRAWNQYIPATLDACLVAVGGYGRGELHPASDIDLLILVGKSPEGRHAQYLEQLVMFLWDIGLEVGHSVRTLEQCIAAASEDVTIITNLMESRYLSGNETLYWRMKESSSPEHIWPSNEFFMAKCDEQKRRHARFGGTAYNLEPNIKSNPGGLRDIQMIGWVVKRHFHAERLSELLHQGFLTDAEYHALKKGQAHLWKIRFALHLLTGRHDDRLLFEHQRNLAREFGYCDEDANLAVEQFMRDYYRTVRELNRLNEMLLQLFQEAILGSGEIADTISINNRFQATNGYLEVSNNAIFARYPLAIMEIFLILQEYPELKGVRARTIRSIRAHLHLLDERFRQDIRARSLFLEILRQPKGVLHALRRMHYYGVLEAYIPAFANITGRMQFDLFHVYTVDEHTLMVVRNLRRFSVPEFSHEFPLCSQVFNQLAKPELIYIAGLFHDIAKGRGGDHAALGAEDARTFCKLHDLSDYDADMVGWLVSRHLLMSNTVQRKDIEDPAVIQDFATLIGDRSRLDYLYLLTVADSRGTNPERWTSWKSSQLNRLYHSTRNLLLRGLENPLDQYEHIQAKQAEAKRQLLSQGHDADQVNTLWRKLELEYFLQNDPEELVWHTRLILSHKNFKQPSVSIRKSAGRGCDEIFIIKEDTPGLFAKCTALIDELHLNILQARIQTTDDHLALNSFFVLEVDGEHISPDGRRTEIIETLSLGLSDGMPAEPFVRPLSRTLKQFSVTSKIETSQDLQNQQTRVSVTTTDRAGVLSMIAYVFASQKLRLVDAKIHTIGAKAEDIFLLTNADGRALDEVQIEALVNQLSQQLNA